MEKGVSKAGVQFYHDLIDELLKNGNLFTNHTYILKLFLLYFGLLSLSLFWNSEITPLVTVFHWDTPQDLEDEYGGFLSDRIM